MLIDSVPPATIADATPHMMRSAAKAIACRPDEQKRLMVTADAVTGSRRAGSRCARRSGPARPPASRSRGSRRRSPRDRAPARVAALRRSTVAAELVRPRAAQRAVRRLADRRPDGGDDDGVFMITDGCSAGLTCTSVTYASSPPADPRARRATSLDLAVEQMVGARRSPRAPSARRRARRTRACPSSGQISSSSPWMKNFGFVLARDAREVVAVETGGAMPMQRR